MRKNLLSFLFLMLVVQFSVAQDVTIIDHEDMATTSTFQFFAGAGGSLEGVISEVIANPNPSGINTSSMVGEFLKNTDSPTWGGGFSDVPVVMDFTTGATEICMKVHMDHVGPILLKLEMSGTNDNWELAQSNTLINEWEEICWDVTQPSAADPNVTAFGHAYSRLTLFFDFNLTVATDQVYYLDDVIVKGGIPPQPGDVTFSVDMSEYGGSFTQMYVSGSFNSWSGTDNPMTDMGNGIWEATVSGIAPGTQEYKFTYDDWVGQEEFQGFEGCVISDGTFHNRRLVVNGDATLDKVCFNSCFDCGDAVKITVNLGAQGITPSAEGIFIAGGASFGIPGDFPLNDDDGDQIWTIVIEQPVGFESHYTFTNGACAADWSCKEDISGQDCADPNNFNDRFMGPLMADTTINTCFGLCSEDTNCPSADNMVTFQVDMNNSGQTFTQMYISGTINGWSGDANPLEDSNNDGIWETTLTLAPGDYQYKFTYDNWVGQEEFMGGEPCTITDPSGPFHNRLLSVSGDTEVCFFWNSCTTCETSTGNLTVSDNLFEAVPTLTNDFTRLNFSENNTDDKIVSVYNAIGELVYEVQVDGLQPQHLVELSDWSSGLYFINVRTQKLIATKRISKF